MKKEEVILSKIMNEREQRGISAESISDFLGIDKRTYWNIENGKSNLSMDKFLKICDFFKLSPNYFFDGNERNIIEAKDCFIVANNDYGTLYFSASEEQLMSKVPKRK